MNRRRFLQSSLIAAAFAPLARAESNENPRAAAGFKVGAGTDRYSEEMLLMGGRFSCKVSSKDSGGDLLIYDTLRQSKGGPALHRHHFQDEWFYVIRGEFVVQVGDQTLRLGPGDSAFAPRKIPHAFAMVGESEGQMLVLFQPAGSMEDFFAQMARIGPGVPKDQEKLLKKLWADHGMEIVGPPLKI
ncbi:MAG TPA: cupin domain-containing protein [Candidatus Didemnitutus sp.]|nr:cupin domain-containing protein [Candidatus Didemnitutus sp.]